MFDFSASMYERLCVALVNADYQSQPFAQYPSVDLNSATPIVILRHDVDRFPKTAIRLAEIERANGLTATYFFRLVPGAFDPDVIRRVAKLGMEVGYHYETLDRAEGDYERAFALVKEDLARLREFGPVTSMAMHGNPLTPYDNRDLWKKYDWREVGITVAAYFTVDYSRIRYFTDTGRNWDTDRGNLYDKVSHQIEVRLRSTNDLIHYIQENPGHTCISTHPHRWTNAPLLWTYNVMYDHAGNIAKKLIRTVRGNRAN